MEMLIALLLSSTAGTLHSALGIPTATTTQPTVDRLRCGQPPVPPSEAPLAGDALPGSWPWLASLKSGSEEPSHICAAIVYSRLWAVTAASCIGTGSGNGTRMEISDSGETRTPLQLHAGAHCRSCRPDESSNASASVQVRSVSRVVLHPGFDSDESELFRNVALLRVDEPGFVGVSPICLPESSASSATNCFSVGWSGIPPADAAADARVLQQVSVPVVSAAVCNETSNFTGSVAGDSICAGGSAVNQSDSCEIFADAFLLCKSNSASPPAPASWELQGIGISSFGCRIAGELTLYAAAFDYRGWIRETADGA